MAYHLTHPDSGQEIEVTAEQVPTYTSQGWETKPGAKPVEDTSTPPPPAAPDTPKVK